MSHAKLLIVTACLLLMGAQAWGRVSSFADESSVPKGIVLTPGTYPTHWVIPEQSSERISPLAGCPFDLVDLSQTPPALLKGKPNLVTNLPIYGQVFFRSRETGQNPTSGDEASENGIPFVIDESNGTGKGYDTLYIDANGDDDLSNDPKITGKPGGRNMPGYLTFTSAATIPVNRIFPHSANPNAGVIDMVIISAEGKPRFGEVMLRGCWTGEADSNVGKLPFKLMDGNGNMRYDDRSSLLSPDDERSGDEVAFDWGRSGKFAPDSRDSESYSLFGGANIGGRLYVFESDVAGSKLEVKNYTGPTAKLAVKFVKMGTARDVDINTTVFGENASYNVDAGAPPISVPAGSYRLGSSFLSCRSKNHQSWLILYSQKKTVAVTKGQTLVIPVGGDVKMSIAPEKQRLVIEKGRQGTFPFAFTTSTGGCIERIQGMTFGSSEGTMKNAAAVEVKGPNGAVVLSGKAEFG